MRKTQEYPNKRAASEIMDYKKILIERNIAEAHEILGVSESEIVEIERIYSVRLPDQYRSFLSSCGRRAGRLASTIHFFYPEVLDIRETYDAIVHEEGIHLDLPGKTFIFSSFEGAIFDVFICDGYHENNVYRIHLNDASIIEERMDFQQHFMGLVETCNSW